MKLLIPALIALCAAAPARAGTRSVSGDFPVRGATEIRIDFPAGDLDVEAGDVDQIGVAMTAECRHGGQGCAERAQRLRLVSDVHGRTRTFKLENYPKFWNHGLQVRLRFTVPRSMAVRIEMGAGELTIRGVAAGVDASLGAGDIEMRLPEAAIARLSGSVGVGDARLTRFGRRIGGSGFIAKHLSWRGDAGAGDVEVHLGVGDLDVSLD